MSAPNMKSVAEKELQKVKIIYRFGVCRDLYGDGGVEVEVLAPTDPDDVLHQHGRIFGSHEKAESWVSQRFNVVDTRRYSSQSPPD